MLSKTSSAVFKPEREKEAKQKCDSCGLYIKKACEYLGEIINQDHSVCSWWISKRDLKSKKVKKWLTKRKNEGGEMKKLLRKIKYIIKDRIARTIMAYIVEEYKHFRGRRINDNRWLHKTR